MAEEPSNNRRKMGGDVTLPAPREGALPPVKEATGTLSSAGSRTQAAGSRSRCGSASKPPQVGHPRDPAGGKSASQTGQETRIQNKGIPSLPRRTDSDTRTEGKTSSSANQHGQGGYPNLEKIGQARIAEIERETRGQRDNPEWFNQRRYRITATAAHKISRCKFVNGRSDEVPQSYLKPIVGQGSNVMTPAMKWGIDHEPHAITEYQKIKSKQEGQEIEVQPCGLFIDPAKNWLAASPDGLVVDKATKRPLGLLEVKCPYKHRNHSIAKACEDKDFCLESKNELHLKKQHPYFTQMQCQMAVTGMRKADLVVYTSCDTAVVPVDYDEHFWLDAVDKLEDFYIRAVLPEKQKGNTVWAREK
ncbi:uncharacterized protein [Narcine bancroftii]|uniref:uncharacterized protein n=1 Tax=Narcine bancroftii TaxID=1343680 RepID=UPI003832068D